ncbi:zinc-dependent alcohol dehydrogenase family protein [Chryseolinea lacunae]|nr:zinc-dependent alcohol dehydrogenase family protein [Chryseolinea lacunae]
MASPLDWREVPTPQPGENEVLIKVSCCGVCHTELDEIEGRTPPPRLPVIPGHQVVGFVIGTGKTATRFHVGDRVGVGWIHSACGSCMFCISGKENLCPSFVATGRDRNGGYAEFLVVHEQFAHSIPAVFSDAEAAPLLCAGAIGYRSLKLAGVSDGQTLGLTGFGASGHLVLKLARHLYPQSKIYVFARSEKEQEFARKLGASWAGAPQEKAPGLSDAIIDTTPVWSSVVNALWQLRPGARLVINAIRKESADQHALLGIRYHDHLWMEKEIKSVANITRADIGEFLSVAAAIPLKSEIELYPFEQANRALVELRHKPVRGAKVLML